MRKWRTIEKVKQSYNVDERVYDEATKVAYPRDSDNRKVQRFSLFHANRKAKLMGHIARTENNDPLRQITFQADTAYRIQYGKKRVGKPRQNWIHQTKKYIYTQKLGYTSYQEENAQDDTILQNAVARIF